MKILKLENLWTTRFWNVVHFQITDISLLGFNMSLVELTFANSNILKLWLIKVTHIPYIYWILPSMILLNVPLTLNLSYSWKSIDNNHLSYLSFYIFLTPKIISLLILNYTVKIFRCSFLTFYFSFIPLLAGRNEWAGPSEIRLRQDWPP